MSEIHRRRSSAIGVSIIGGLFFVFGFVTWLNGALIPFLTIACELDHLQAYFVTLVFYIAYTAMGLLNKGAGVVAPLIFTALVLSDISQFTAARMESLDSAQRLLQLDELSRRLIEPYLVLAGILVLLAAYIKLFPLPDPEPSGERMATGRGRGIFRHPSLVLGAVTLFFYVGAEVVAGDTIALFGLANALVWPAVWPMALRGLNREQTGTGSALLIMGIAGGAFVPVIFAALTEYSADPRIGYGVMLPCYLFILYYALAGHKLEQWAWPSARKTVGIR